MYANNGSTDYIDQVASVSVATKLKKNEFTKKDYRFLGWSKEAEGQVLYGDEEEVSENIRERDQIIELYAIWALNNYRVIYDKGIARDINSETHDISGIVTVGVATINELYKVKDNAFSVEGFTFIGWDIEENTNYGRYKEKAETKELEGLIDENHEVKLYAQWKEIEAYVLTNYDVIKVDGSTDISQVNVKSIKVDTGFSKVIEKDNAVVEYVAILQEEVVSRFTMRLHIEGEDSQYVDQLVYIAEETKLIENPFIKTNYEFIGWSKTVGGEKAYDDQDIIQETVTEHNTIINLFAMWRKYTYSISFNGKGGSGSMDAIVGVEAGETIELPENGFDKEDYNFKGWSLFESTPRVDYTDTFTRSMCKGDSDVVVLYAVWRLPNYNVTYKSNSKRAKTIDNLTEYSVTVKTDEDYIVEDEFLYSGYMVEYYTTNLNNTGDRYYPGFKYMNLTTERSITLYAHWTKIKSGGTGGGGGGGGGGGNGGGTLPADIGSSRGVVDSILNAAITGVDGTWVYYPEENKWGYKISVNNEVAQAIMKDQELVTKYALVDEGTNIQLKNGMYRIIDGLIDNYYAFDNRGRMITGFITTTEDTKMYGINLETQEIEESAYTDQGKYYLYESGMHLGAICTEIITIDYVTYIFDEKGKVVMEIQNIIDNGGSWEYNSDTNKWIYNKLNEDGTYTTLKDGAYAIPVLNGIYYYIFDEDGNMMTGMTKYNGHTFYLQETGLLKGTVYTGDIEIDGNVYTFSPSTGELVNIVDMNSQVIPVI